MEIDAIYKIMPHCPKEWAEAIVSSLTPLGIDTPLRQAAFLAQIAHESMECSRLEENLNYSAMGLIATFKSHFLKKTESGEDVPDLALANRYSRQPEKIANHVYANRNGNGDEVGGDGWKYRGRGPIQITGKSNYTECGIKTNLPLVEVPDSLLLPNDGITSAVWFWTSRNLNFYADAKDMETITKRINGGLLGFKERMNYYNKALEVLKI